MLAPEEQLIEILKTFSALFSGGLGTIDVESIYFEIKECTEPKHSKPCPVPKAFGKTDKEEMREIL